MQKEERRKNEERKKKEKDLDLFVWENTGIYKRILLFSRLIHVDR